MDFSPNQLIDLSKLYEAVTDHYINYVVSTVNNHVVRMSVMTEDFYWHYHPNSDETFIVLEGTLLLDLKTGTTELTKGQIFTVLANTHHRTRPKGTRSVNLTFELADMETVKL